MADSMRAAAALADRLGDQVEVVLPDSEPVIDTGQLSARRVELRQVAGLSAGGEMELEPGRWEFGPGQHSSGPLQSGDPDRVAFTLLVDEDRRVMIEPGDETVRLDGREVDGLLQVGARTIDAGSARFIVTRPRPKHRRGGGVERLPKDGEPAALAPLPPSSISRAAAQERARLHLGPEEIQHRISGGRSRLWNRSVNHPLFATAVVGFGDVPLKQPGGGRRRGAVQSVPVPVSLDLLGLSTVVNGERELQLAVVRQLLMSLVATTHPRDLHIDLQSDQPELAFVRELPHAKSKGGRRGGRKRPTLLVIDQDQPTGGDEAEDGTGQWPVLADGGALLVVGRRRQPIPDGAQVVLVGDETSLSVRSGGSDRRWFRGLTPVGYAETMVADLAELLGRANGSASRSGDDRGASQGRPAGADTNP